VRQGSTTIVLDPNESTDIRLIQLQIEIADPGPSLSASALEMQAMFAVPLLALAERRITAQELATLAQLVEQLPETATPDQALRFRNEYMRVLAKASRNPLYQQQVRWWGTMIGELERRGRAILVPPGGRAYREFYTVLTKALTERTGASQVWLDGIGPMLDA